jgi:hypothetical protein
VDTLSSPPGGLVYGIWGSSPSDVWAVAGGTGIHNLFHFNGSEWSIRPGIGGDLEAIYGFAQNDVWMGGNDGRIYHFDGHNWALAFTYKPEGTYISAISDIWGTAPNNIYAVGVIAVNDGSDSYQSFLLHYNGTNWREIYRTNFDVQFVKVRSYKGKAHIFAIKLGIYPVPDELFVYRFSNSRLQNMISRTTNEFRSFSMNNVGNRILTVINNELLLLKDDLFKANITFNNFQNIVAFGGRHMNDLFLFTDHDVIHHNGQNQQSILSGLPRNVFRHLFFPNDVFLLIRDFNSNTNLIYHGILNEQESLPN